MSSEITLTTKLALAVGSVSLSHGATVRADQTTAGNVFLRQAVPTSDTVIVLTGVTTPRMISIKNTDATNYIDIGPTVAGAIAPMIRLLPGEVCVMPLKPSVVLRGQAHTATVTIEYLIVET